MQVCSLKSPGWMHENPWSSLSLSFSFSVVEISRNIRETYPSRVLFRKATLILVHPDGGDSGLQRPRIRTSFRHRTEQIRERKNLSCTHDRLEATWHRKAGTTPSAETSRNGINPLLLFTQKCRQTEIREDEEAAGVAVRRRGVSKKFN